jgi:enoyl-CoA hydratase
MRIEALNDENEIVRAETEDGIAVVRLNRAAKLNALTAGMLSRLTQIFRDAETKENLRAIILTGAGDAFSAGTDIASLLDITEAEAREVSRRGQSACNAIESCAVPVIAALNGAAIGGGCELALSCHLRVAAKDVRFGLPETHLGLLPAYGGTQRLARLVGRGRALAAMLAGEEIKADEAYSLGLVNEVVERDEVVAAAMKLGEKIAASAPLAVRACLRAVVEGSRLELQQGLELEAELFSRLFGTEDVREGTRAFLEKRKPVFNGA